MSNDDRRMLLLLAAAAGAVWWYSLPRGIGWPGIGTGKDQGGRKGAPKPPAAPKGTVRSSSSLPGTGGAGKGTRYIEVTGPRIVPGPTSKP